MFIDIQYQFTDLGDASCRDIARAHSQLLLGRIAVNSSFDSGLLSMPDWQSINNFPVSPIITEEFINAWPVSHDEYCDEWWIFDNVVPPTFKVKPFCNFIGERIADYQNLAWENGCPLDRYLESFQPEAVFGNNQNAYLIQRLTQHK